VPDEDLIEVGLYFGVPVGLEVGVVEVLSVFAAAGGVVALVGVLFEQRGDVQFVLFFGDLGEAVPVEERVHADLVLALEVRVDDGVLEDVLAVGEEEVGEE